MTARNVEFDVINYLEQPLDRETLEDLLRKLGGDPGELLRVTDKQFAEAGLVKQERYTAEEVVTILLEHGNVMQRPVVVKGEKAIIARPGNLVEGLL